MPTQCNTKRHWSRTMQLLRTSAAKHHSGVDYFFVMTLRGTLSATTSMRPAVGSVARILVTTKNIKHIFMRDGTTSERKLSWETSPVRRDCWYHEPCFIPDINELHYELHRKLFLTNKRVKTENFQQESIVISNLTQIVVCLYNVSAHAPARNVTVKKTQLSTKTSMCATGIMYFQQRCSWNRKLQQMSKSLLNNKPVWAELPPLVQLDLRR